MIASVLDKVEYGVISLEEFFPVRHKYSGEVY